jgi:hypothetical protein
MPCASCGSKSISNGNIAARSSFTLGNTRTRIIRRFNSAPVQYTKQATPQNIINKKNTFVLGTLH